MKKLFDMNNPFMKTLTVAADLLILNLLVIVVSIPLITIGPAMTAMNDIVIRIVRGIEGYTVRPFFKSFAANFKKGALLSLILIAVGAIIYFDYLAAVTYIPQMRAAIIAIGVIALAIFSYAFALMARYENTIRATLKNAVILAVANFPRTLLMVVASVGLWVACVNFYKIGTPILVLFGFSLPCYVNILMINGVFHKMDGDLPDENGKE